MNTLLVSYDLYKPGQGYQVLYETLKSFGTWWHCLDSVWIVRTSYSATQVRDQLAHHIDNNDRLLVVSLTGQSGWSGFDPKCSTWLKENL